MMSDCKGSGRLSSEIKARIQQAMLQQDNGSDVEPPSEILDGFLFLGDFENANCKSQLEGLGISHVLNITTNPELGKHDGIETLYLYIQDYEFENIRGLFTRACEFIDSSRESQGRVLVHCMAGRSRSASIVIAYLMRNQQMPLDEAFFFTKTRRPIILPNFGFWGQLMEEEMALFGKNSPMPSLYQKLQEIFGGRKVTPGSFFQYYVTPYLNGSREDCSRVVRDWPEGMGGGSSVEDILLKSLEHLSSKGREAAVAFIVELRDAKRVTQGEVFEGFSQLLQNTDFEDLKIDIPLIVEYLTELLTMAQSKDLIPSGSLEVPKI